MPRNPLPLTIQAQECTEWCWAAVVSSIASFVGLSPAPKQCEIVDREAFSPHDPSPGCCSPANSCKGNPGSACNRNSSVGRALADYGLTETPAGQVPSPSSFASIAQQVDLCCPVVIQLVDSANPAIAHVMVVIGYSGNDTLFVADPADGSSGHTYSYSELLNPAAGPIGVSAWRLTKLFITVPGQC